MEITIKYFASLSEELGKKEEQFTMESNLSVTELWDKISENQAMPVNTLVAINMEYATPDSMIQAGDEVAFFPPVTGG